MKPIVPCAAALVVAGLVACKEPPEPAPASPPSLPSATAPASPAAAAPAPAPAANATATRAEVGKPAPDFALKDLDGKTVKLSDLRGKTVVLEWFNPECPFVKMSHTKGSLKGLASKRTALGITWLAIDSSAPGKQGSDPAVIRDGAKRLGMTHPILLDADGAVGHAYGATNTPHMFVIDPDGVLAYRGAIDNSPDAEGESPTGGKLINYVDAALDAVAAKRAPDTKETQAYGCSVKYP